MDHHDLLSGFLRLHVLHHAAEGDIYGKWMIEELARHGYTLSPGTLYPMLHAVEEKGYLTSREDQGGPGGRRRRLYAATSLGHEALAVARERLRELVGEVMPESDLEIVWKAPPAQIALRAIPVCAKPL